MVTKDMEPLLLNEKQVSALTGYSLHTLRKWRSQGDGPRFVKNGNDRYGSVRYSPADIQEWADNRKRAKVAA